MGSPTQDDIDGLIHWATSHGATIKPSIEIYHSSQTGLSFRVSPSSSTALQPWDSIVSISPTLTLSYLDAVILRRGQQRRRRQRHYSFLPATVLSALPPHVIGRLFLIEQFLWGEGSFWYPYIATLPQPYRDQDAWALPPFWDDDDVELFDGTNLEAGIKKIRTDVQTEFTTVSGLLRSVRNREDEGEGEDDGAAMIVDNFSMLLYRWAYCIFSSRSFRPSLVLPSSQQAYLPPGVDMDDFSVLLPFFDVGNHDMAAPVRWDMELDQESGVGRSSGGGGGGSDDGNYRCHLRVGRLHEPGDQVFNNYGLKTNAELLLGYGFILPQTEELHNDYVHVRKRMVSDANSSSSGGGGEKAGEVPEEYYISLRPTTHRSSLLVQSRQPSLLINSPSPSSSSSSELSAFTHVPHTMVWDILCKLTTPTQRQELLFPNHTTEEQQRDAFLRGNLSSTATATEYLEHTVAIIQHKVMQELEKLEEMDVEVGGDDEARLTRRQRLALEYRERCRAVLENTLETMGAGIDYSVDDER